VLVKPYTAPCAVPGSAPWDLKVPLVVIARRPALWVICPILSCRLVCSRIPDQGRSERRGISSRQYLWPFVALALCVWTEHQGDVCRLSSQRPRWSLLVHLGSSGCPRSGSHHRLPSAADINRAATYSAPPSAVGVASISLVRSRRHARLSPRAVLAPRRIGVVSRIALLHVGDSRNWDFTFREHGFDQIDLFRRSFSSLGLGARLEDPECSAAPYAGLVAMSLPAEVQHATPSRPSIRARYHESVTGRAHRGSPTCAVGLYLEGDQPLVISCAPTLVLQFPR